MATAAQKTEMFDPKTLEQPFEFYDQMHASGTKIEALADGKTFIAYDYSLVADAAARPQDFSNDFRALMGASDPEVEAILATGWPTENTLLTADPPIHTRFRKLVNLAFSAPRVNAIEAAMRAKTVKLIESFADQGACEFLEDFAVPLPVYMIASQLGIEDDMHRVKDWSDAAVDRFSQMVDRARELECVHSYIEYQHFMKAEIDKRRADGGDDLLSDLVEARVDGEEPLTDAEIMSIMQQFMVAGNETTTSTLAGGLLNLIRHPDQMEKAKAAAGGKNPKLIANMVEEILRMETPSAGMWRIVIRDSELGGMHLPKGSILQIRYAAANRDPAVYEDPNTLNIERKNARTHLAFGRGVHMCVGNMLSRKELCVAFDELLSRLTDFDVTDESALSYPPNILLRGLTKLPISFTRA